MIACNSLYYPKNSCSHKGRNSGNKGGGLVLIYLILAMVFSVSVTVFALQNAMPVTINFLSWSGSTSFAVVVLGSTGAGVLIALLSQAMVQLRLRLSLRQSEKRIHELEKALVKTEISNQDTKFIEKLEPEQVLVTRGEGL
jgi:lipopolysaccharide assembly protein A